MASSIHKLIVAAIIGLSLCAIGSRTAVANPSDDCEGAYENEDYTSALNLCGVLANQGDAVAQWEMGVMYGHGYGVAENDSEAVKWYRLAAKQGNSDAQVSLGYSYANGNGVKTDFVRAYMWVSLAAEQGDANGATDRDLFATKLTATELVHARDMAQNCKSSSYKACN